MTGNLPDSEGSRLHATTLSEAMLGWLRPLAVDLVISGEGHGEIGLMIVPDREVFVQNGMSLDEAGGVMICTRALAALRERLTDWNAAERGASHQIGAALFLAEPPQLGEGEVSAKGDLNGHKIMARRADILDALNAGSAGVVRL